MSARYEPDSAGMRAFMNSAGVSNAMRSVADDMAAQVRAQGRSTYESRPRTVQGGWRASNRAGAEVVDLRTDYRDTRKRLLVNLSNSFRMRGGG